MCLHYQTIKNFPRIVAVFILDVKFGRISCTDAGSCSFPDSSLLSCLFHRTWRCRSVWMLLYKHGLVWRDPSPSVIKFVSDLPSLHFLSISFYNHFFFTVNSFAFLSWKCSRTSQTHTFFCDMLPFWIGWNRKNLD